MAPIFDFVNFILSKYFEEILNHHYIKQLELPLWFFLLVGVFVVLVFLWIFLIVHGLKYVIYRYLISGSRNSSNKRKAASEESFGDRADTLHTNGTCESYYVRAHTHAGKPTHRIGTVEH